MKRFEEFVKDEYGFVYENCDNMEVLLDGFDISDDAKEKIETNMFDKIMPKAIEKLINDDWFWQELHETMDDYLIEAIKEFFIEE